MKHASAHGITPVHMVWLLYESRQPDWRDSNEPDLRNKFRPGSFLKIILKQGQNKKKSD
jgi:hypothetical protein